MKQLTIGLLLALLFSSTSVFARGRKLEMVKTLCTTMNSWEAEAKCFRLGVDGLTNRSSINGLIQNLCMKGPSWENESKCFRMAVQNYADGDTEINSKECSRFETWEGEAKCYRRNFIDRNDDDWDRLIEESNKVMESSKK